MIPPKLLYLTHHGCHTIVLIFEVLSATAEDTGRHWMPLRETRD